MSRKYSLTRSAEKNDDKEKEAGDEQRVTSLEGWMIYWIVVGFWTCIERILDISVFWLPLYNEFKVAFCIYLWHPNTRGAADSTRLAPANLYRCDAMPDA